MGEHGQLDVLEVERHGGFLRGSRDRDRGGRREDREQRDRGASHRRSYTSVRGWPPRSMSSATRGSVRSLARKARSAAGSPIAVPLTRWTTSPSSMPSRRNKLSSRIWNRRNPAG